MHHLRYKHLSSRVADDKLSITSLDQYTERTPLLDGKNMDLARLGFPNKTKPYLQQTKIASLRLKDWTKKSCLGIQQQRMMEIIVFLGDLNLRISKTARNDEIMMVVQMILMMMVILVHGDDGCNGDDDNDNAAGQTTCAAKKKGSPSCSPDLHHHSHFHLIYILIIT